MKTNELTEHEKFYMEKRDESRTAGKEANWGHSNGGFDRNQLCEAYLSTFSEEEQQEYAEFYRKVCAR